MALVRRHWKLALLNILLLTGALVAFVVHLSGGRTTVAAIAMPATTQAASGIDPLTYRDVAELRVRLCLTNDDLAALGCTQQQATAVLNQLLQWYRGNQSQLMALRQAQLAASMACRDLVDQINVGPRNEAVLAQMGPTKQRLLTAIGQTAGLVNSAASTISPTLSATQNQSWQVSREHPGIPRRFRYLDGVSSQEIKQLSFATAKYGEGSPQASAAEQAIGQGPIAAAGQSIANNLQNSMEGVLAGERDVLPVPSTLVVAIQRPSAIVSH